MVASLVQITHLFSVTPILPMGVSAPDALMDVRARLISPSKAAISPRYERSSPPIAARKLWLTRPSSRDSTYLERVRYNRDGSAKVCNNDINGSGRVRGSFRMGSSVKGRCVVERPCRVKGRSCKSATSVGGVSLTAVISLGGSSDGSTILTSLPLTFAEPLRMSSPPTWGRLMCDGS